MNKSELIKEASKKSSLTSEDCKKCINAITELISEVLKRGDKVYISGFGKFETKIIPEKIFYNPITEKKQVSCQKIVPIFKSGKQFKNNLIN